MRKKCILVFLFTLTMGLAACSSGSRESTGPAETILEQEPENKEPAISETNDDETPKPEAAEDTEKETVQDEEVIEADPITGIVKAYADDTITIKDPGDGLFYYFSTENAEIIEGDSPIAVGDTVEITYRGLLGNEKNPGEAVKIAAVIVK